METNNEIEYEKVANEYLKKFGYFPFSDEESEPTIEELKWCIKNNEKFNKESTPAIQS